MNLWAGATKASPQSTVGHTSARPDLKSQVGHSKHAQGNSQEQPRVHGGQGGTCRNLAPHHKKDLVGGQPRNSSEWSQVTQGAHGHTGDEAQGTQLSPIQHLPAVYPDQLQAYQSFPASAEHTGIHPEASPKGPQQAPGKPHLTLNSASSLPKHEAHVGYIQNSSIQGQSFKAGEQALSTDRIKHRKSYKISGQKNTLQKTE